MSELRDRIAALAVEPPVDRDETIYNLAIGDALRVIAAAQPAADAVDDIAAAMRAPGSKEGQS